MSIGASAAGQSLVSNGNYDNPYKIESPYQGGFKTTANPTLEQFPFYGGQPTGTNWQTSTRGNLNFSDSMHQLNQAIHPPGQDGSHSRLMTDTTAGSANASDTQDNDNKAKQPQEQDEAQQKNQGQKIQRDQEKESRTQSQEAQKAQSQNQDQARPNMMNGGQEQSPGQQLNQEVQATRQEMQNSPPNSSQNSGRSSGSLLTSTSRTAIGGDSEVSHPENVFVQVGQKAHMADQQHRQGKQQGLMGLMQQLKGAALEKAGEIQTKVGTALNTVGTAIESVGESLESNPFTAAIGAALVAVGKALKAAGTALKAAGMAQKMTGEMESKSGKTIEQNGEKMTQKARKSVDEGHLQLENLRTKKSEQEFQPMKPDQQESQANTDVSNGKGIFSLNADPNNPKTSAPWRMDNQPPDQHIHPLNAWTGTA